MVTDPECGDCLCDITAEEYHAIARYPKMAEALIEIAVRNGPRISEIAGFHTQWDPVAAKSRAAQLGIINGSADDYCTAARALGIL